MLERLEEVIYSDQISKQQSPNSNERRLVSIVKKKMMRDWNGGKKADFCSGKRTAKAAQGLQK